MSEIVFKPPDSDCYYPAEADGFCYGYPRFQVFPADQHLVLLDKMLEIVERRINILKIDGYREHRLYTADSCRHRLFEAKKVLRCLEMEKRGGDDDE